MSQTTINLQTKLTCNLQSTLMRSGFVSTLLGMVVNSDEPAELKE